MRPVGCLVDDDKILEIWHCCAGFSISETSFPISCLTRRCFPALHSLSNDGLCQVADRDAKLVVRLPRLAVLEVAVERKQRCPDFLWLED